MCLVLVARILGVPADSGQLAHRFAPQEGRCSGRELIRAGRFLGLKVREVGSSWSRLQKTPLPAIARNTDGHHVVVAKIDAQQVLIQDPREPRPLTFPRQIFESAWSGRLLLLTRRAEVLCGEVKFGLGWFVAVLGKYRHLLSEVLAASFFIQVFALVTPLFFQVVIDKVLLHKGLTTLNALAVGLIAVSLFEVVLSGLRTYVFAHTTSRVDVQLGARLFHHLLSLPLSYFESRRVGDSVARVRELETIRNFITGSALTLVIDLSFTVVFLAVMYCYSPLLTHIVLGAIPFYVLLSLFVTPVLRARVHDKFNRGAENQALLVEAVTGVETIKAMAVEPQMQLRWEEQLAAYVRASFRAATLNNIANQTAGFISKIVTVLILWVGAQAVISGDLSLGQLIAFNMLAGHTSGPILRLVQLWQDFQQAGVSLQRLGDILNTASEPGYRRNRTSLPQVAGHIRFEHVTFRYRPDGPEVLRDFTLDVSRGQVIGVVGPSGSGKSTLAKLVQRMYVPERGRVLVDGVDLAMVDTAWLRRQIGVVLQENLLFNRSVRDNIALSNPGMPLELVIRAARLAGAHEFILEMPEGYDTLVGEHGATLSGGQRQRIAIARALISNPRILILDEATSALDYESERVVQKNMQAIAKGRTVLVIAHRLSAVRQANQIVVLERGMLVERGNHDELLRRGGRYARLHACQTGCVAAFGTS
jgi:subfamily B ATP-binding cassette protein HlyB/CyaB